MIFTLILKIESKFNYTGSNITFNFLTPTRLVYQQDLVVRPDFHHIIRGALRRLATLSLVHYGERLDVDFTDLINRSQSVGEVFDNTVWYDWERYSNRQKTRMKLGGFVGRVGFEGQLTDFIPFIKACEYFHIGKNTSFGLGLYETDTDIRTDFSL